MTSRPSSALSRRHFVSTLGAAALLAPVLARGAEAAAPKQPTTKQPATLPPTPITFPPRKPYIGIELYGVRGEMQKDLANTVRRVAKMGYECAEFYSPYLQWTFSYAKDVRRLLDEVGLRCLSTHNPAAALIDPGTMAKAIELNQILGSGHIVAASPPRGAAGVDGWKKVAEQFTAAVGELKPHGLRAGYHNHATEWKPLSEGGPHVMNVIAQNTPHDFTLQFDVGTAVESGVDTVAWIHANPGRIRTVHLKDWAPGTREEEKSYRVLFTEGVTPWKQLIAAAESVGGVEFFLMEQEGSRYSEFESQERSLANWKKLRAAG